MDRKQDIREWLTVAWPFLVFLSIGIITFLALTGQGTDWATMLAFVGVGVTAGASILALVVTWNDMDDDTLDMDDIAWSVAEHEATAMYNICASIWQAIRPEQETPSWDELTDTERADMIASDTFTSFHRQAIHSIYRHIHQGSPRTAASPSTTTRPVQAGNGPAALTRQGKEWEA